MKSRIAFLLAAVSLVGAGCGRTEQPTTAQKLSALSPAEQSPDHGASNDLPTAGGHVADSLTVYPTPTSRDDGIEEQSLVSFGTDAFAVVVNGSASLQLLTDQRGAVEKIVGQDGNPIVIFRISPYGKLDATSTAQAPNLRSLELVERFTGGLRDRDSELVHMGAREYLAAAGGFTTPDPLFMSNPALCIESTNECSAHRYVGGDPINFVDPTGTKGFWAKLWAKRPWKTGKSKTDKGKAKASTTLGNPEHGSGLQSLEQGDPGSQITTAPRRPFSGTKYESMYEARHLPGTPQSDKTKRNDGSTHVFLDQDTLDYVHNEIVKRGEFTGRASDTDRFGLRFEEKIGTRFDRDDPAKDMDLHYGEAKVRDDGSYHVMPRTRASK